MKIISRPRCYCGFIGAWELTVKCAVGHVYFFVDPYITNVDLL